MLRDVLLRVLVLRQLHGPTARIILCCVDVKDAFRLVKVDPVGAPVLGYAMGEYVVVDLRLQFRWRSSPGFWGLMASALEHAHTHSTFQNVAVSPQGAAAVKHVRLAPPRGASVTPLPRDCRTVSGSGGSAGSRFFVRYYVDDGIRVEIQWWPDGRRYMRAVQPLASDQFRLLGVRGASDPPLLSASKITNWNTRLEVLGWLVDTEALTVTSPPHKRLKLRFRLAEWPPTRTYASAKQVSQLAGFLIPISFAVRHGPFFMHRSLASVGICRASKPVTTSMAEWPIRGGVSPLGPSSIWIKSSGGGLLTKLLTRAAGCYRRRGIICWSTRLNARCFRTRQKTAVGGYCLETGAYWRYDLTAQE